MIRVCDAVKHLTLYLIFTICRVNLILLLFDHAFDVFVTHHQTHMRLSLIALLFVGILVVIDKFLMILFLHPSGN